MKKNLTDLLKALRNGKLPSKHFQKGDVFIFEGNEPAMELNESGFNSVSLKLQRTEPVEVFILYNTERKFRVRVADMHRVYLFEQYQCPIKAGKAVNALLKTL